MTTANIDVVLLHGFGLGAGSWEPVIAQLEVRVSGRSDVTVNPIAIEMCPPGAYVPAPDRVRSVIDGRPQAMRVLVGHSLGSHVALDLMAADPRSADAVLLLSVGSDEADPEFFRTRAHNYAALLRNEGVGGFATQFLSEPRFMDSAGVLRRRELLARAIAAGDAKALAACADDYLPYAELTGELVARIAPSADWSLWTVVAGRGDAPALAWIPVAREMMPGSRVEVVDDAAHLLPTDCPERIANEILRLVDVVLAKSIAP
jgi:pimeloyl-ACP methyl ester carboxylesterase